KALHAYLKRRSDNNPALWVTSADERLAMSSLQGMLQRRGQSAGIKPPSPHDFRRGFALAMLRAGVDLITLAGWMGHSSLEVLKRYTKQNTEDLRLAHEYGKQIGKPGLAPHDLRRTYAQLGYNAGVPITQISVLSGHSSVKTTQEYLNLNLDLESTASDFVPLAG
ncbi:MAG TPA: site-specific integrase, partial [Candidatus Saccharimonadales bacterium]|nr:site-specific integrase [Candidatus Saccharimonadales bacterium]